MSNDHTRWEDFAGAYVLGAMAVAEREEFEAHLSTCAICREEVEELQPAAEALPMASPLMAPPPGLKDRIMAEVEREAELLGAAGAGADRPERTRRERRGLGWLSGWRLAPVAAALVIAGVLVGVALERARQRTIVRDSRPGASAELAGRGRPATLVARTCPPRPRAASTRSGCMPERLDHAASRPTCCSCRAGRLGRGRDPRLGRGHRPGAGHRRAASAAPTTPTGELLMAAELS